MTAPGACVPFPLAGRRVWVAGHTGLVGSALVRRLNAAEAEILSVTHAACDLRDQRAVRLWVAENRPEAVMICAGLVGGIEANRTRPAEFLYDNMMIAANVIHASAEEGVKKLMFLGSSCFYPREAPQPIREDALLTAPFEPTNEWYAVAKLAGVRLCQAYRRQYGKDFIAAVPTNLYGPGDNFDLAASHVIAALIRRFDEARKAGASSVELWGSGRPVREFLYVDDAADALVYLMENYSSEEMINVAGGECSSISELARLIAQITGYTGEIRFDLSRPDGMPRKALDGLRLLATGWRPGVSFREGLERTYEWFAARSGVLE
jgi:GDP-L-fucose synthase